MYCKKCGAKLDDGAKFCSQCGAATNASVATPTMPQQKKLSVIKRIALGLYIALLAIFCLTYLPSFSSIIFFLCIALLLPIKLWEQIIPRFYLRVLITVALVFVAIMIYPTCDHEYTVIENIEPTCTEEGRVVQQCILCEKDDTENLKALGHLWKTETEVKAECDSAGYVIEKCDRCSETQKIETDVALGHDMKEISRIEATDDKDGMIDYKCIRCGINKSETIKNSNPKGSEGNPYVLNADKWYSDHCSGTSQNKYRDKWVKTSGIVLTISDYGGLKGYYLAGGQGSGLVCWVYSDDTDAQYGQYVEYIGRVSVEDSKHIEITDGKIVAAQWPSEKIKSPITISDWSWSRDYVGGVEWNFRLTNNTDKTVKYVTMMWNCYNAVGDLVYDEITGKSYHGVKYTGPLNPNETTDYLRNPTLFYCHSFNSSKFTLLEVEFTDGTIIQINDKAYTDYYVDNLEAETVIGRDGIKYIVNNNLNTCYIADIGTCTDTYMGILSRLYGDVVIGIGDFAFANANFIETVSITTTLKSIGNGAFSNCTSLKVIEYSGTVEEWNAISKGENWHQNVPATEVICLDGTVPLE